MDKLEMIKNALEEDLRQCNDILSRMDNKKIESSSMLVILWKTRKSIIEKYLRMVNDE